MARRPLPKPARMTPPRQGRYQRNRAKTNRARAKKRLETARTHVPTVAGHLVLYHGVLLLARKRAGYEVSHQIVKAGRGRNKLSVQRSLLQTSRLRLGFKQNSGYVQGMSDAGAREVVWAEGMSPPRTDSWISSPL